MTSPYRPILGAVAYVTRGEDVLVVHRTFKPHHAQHGRYNGLGGKLEPGEDAVAAIRRELREEAGIEATSMQLRGTINWPVLSGPGGDWFGFVFRVDAFTGEPPDANDEGTLHWIPRAQLAELPLPEGDLLWLPLVFDQDVGHFSAVVAYRDGHPSGFSVSVLPA